MVFLRGLRRQPVHVAGWRQQHPQHIVVIIAELRQIDGEKDVHFIGRLQRVRVVGSVDAYVRAIGDEFCAPGEPDKSNLLAFNGDVLRDLAAQVVALAEKQGSAVPLMIGQRLMGMSLLHTGEMAEGRMHFDRAIAFYDPGAHRRLATRFGQDLRVAILSYRSFALWMLGYPEAALADTEHALKDAREIGHAATLMYTLANAHFTHFLCRNHEIVKTLVDELGERDRRLAAEGKPKPLGEVARQAAMLDGYEVAVSRQPAQILDAESRRCLGVVPFRVLAEADVHDRQPRLSLCRTRKVPCTGNLWE
jgi:hypothetical protein